MSREEEYFEPGSVNGEDVKKFKKEEDDKSYEYFVAKDENNCVVGHAYVLKSAQGSIRLEKQCSNVKAIKKEEFVVKDEPPKITMKSSEPQDHKGHSGEHIGKTRDIGKRLPSEQREEASAGKIRAQVVAKVGGNGEKFKCLAEKNSKVIILFFHVSS